MARRPNQVSIPNPEFGVDFDASARAMHQSASKGSLMVNETAFSMPAVVRKSLTATLFERNTMLKTLKRKIALVAVAALGAGGLAVVAAPSAFATAESKTATISPVRVSFTGAAADAVPAATLSFSTVLALTDATTSAVLTVTSAPNSAVKVTASQDLDNTGFDNLATAAGVVAATKVLSGDVAANAAGTTVKIPIYLDQATAAAGTYAGTYVITDTTQTGGTNDVITISWSFTTVGAPASWTLTQTSASVLRSGVDTATVTLKDSAGNTTQPGAFDSFALTTTAGTITDAAGDVNATLSAAELSTGTAALTFTAANADSTTTVTATPGGVLPFQGIAAKTLSYTVSGTILAGALTAMTVTSPTNAVLVADVTTGNSNTAAIPAGTSAVTVGFTGTASSKYRFKISGLAGTINGAAATTAQYVNVDTDALGKGSIALTLGGSALIEGAGTRVTVEQVTVANVAATNDVDIVITQTARAAAAGTITLSPTGANIAKLGTAAAPTVTPVTVTVADQFGDPIGAGYTVRAYRTAVDNANLLSTAVTAANGTASLTVSHATTLVAAGLENYLFTAIAPGVASITATAQIAMSYSTDGNITGMTTTITGGGTTNLAAAAGTGVGATAATEQTSYSVIEVPADGTANDADLDGVYTVSTAAVTKTVVANAYDATLGAVGNAGELLTLSTDTNPNNAAVYTTSEGLFLCKTTSCAWNAGLTSATISDTDPVYVFGTKTGIGTVTIKSGGLTREVKVFVKNAATNFYTLTASPATASVAGGSYGTITVSVKDIFGNAVDTGANDLAVTADGAVLLGGMAASTTTGTGAAGTATVTYIGNNTGGSGTITIEGVPTTGAWATGYTKPTGAGDPSKKATVALTVAAASAAANPEITAVKADVKAVSDTVATLSKAVTTIQSSVTELTSSFSAQIKSLSSAIAKISRAIAALSKKIK